MANETENFIICTFYTDDYADYYPTWAKHIAQWGYRYAFMEMPKKETWVETVLQKPKVIKMMMESEPQKNVVWIDVDAKVVKQPVLFEQLSKAEYDLASRRLPANMIEKAQCDRFWQDKVVTTPTLWIANNENGRKLVDLWIKDCEVFKDNWIGDHINLNRVLADHADDIGLRFYDLPVTCAYCPRYKSREEPHAKFEDAVILQDAASRKHRTKRERHERNMLCQKH